MKPGQERGPKGISGTDRIDHFDPWGIDVHAEAGAHANGALRPNCYNDEARTSRENALRRFLGAELWKKPGEIGIAGLDDRALLHQRIQTAAI
jgi:hypothetical protein